MAASLQSGSNSPSRRTLLAGALGGIGAWAASAMDRASPARAQGEPITVGGVFTDATSVTEIQNQANANTVFYANSTGGGYGVYGSSHGAFGVNGVSDLSNGVRGLSGSSTYAGTLGHNSGNGTGLHGFSGVATPPLAPAKTGVYGSANQDGTSNGVFGQSSTGTGVLALATSANGSSAFGLFARSDSANAAAIGARSSADRTAVLAMSGSGTFPPSKAKTAVYGYANQDNTAKGVWGDTISGHAIHGTAGPSGYAGYFAGKVFTTKWYEMKEITPPPAPSGNKGRLFMRDNGSGKTQLCVRFNTGAIQVLATQP